MPIEGPLKELSIQDVLQLLELARKTGVLTVRSERLNDEAIAHFERGSIVFAVRRRSMRRLGQQLLRSGKVTDRELERALELQRRDPMQRLGEILLEMGSVDREELRRQLTYQVEETVYELMAWDEGHFRFEELPDVFPERLGVRVRVESLLMEGARRIDEWTRLEQKVPSLESVPALAPSEDGNAAPLELRADEWEVLAEIDGERDIRQLAADLGLGSFDVAKIVYGLASMGLVRVQERRARMPEAELHAALAEVDHMLDAREVEAAARTLRELEVAYPERAEIAILSGRAHALQGRMRAATEAFARAVGLDPLLPEAHYQLGFAALRTGELERAARAWDAYLRLADDELHREFIREALGALQSLNQLLTKETVFA